MPKEQDGKVFLTTSEAQIFLDVSYLTFKKIEEQYGLKAQSFVGEQRKRFFLRDALELIKGSPTNKADEIKEHIAELQKAL